MRKILKNKTDVPVPDELVYENEISQEGNLNATTRLWIQNNGTLFKQYVVYNELTMKNIDNLLRLASYRALQKIPELSLPLEIYITAGRVDGYLMKYHNLKTLATYFDKREPLVVLSAFHHLAALINKLPKDVFIGDLHASNVLVNESEIRLIDIDGFSLKYGHKLSCPLEVYSNHSIFHHRKYHNKTGNFNISRESDIACLLWLLLSYLMETNPFNYTEAELKLYLDFLKKLGVPNDLYGMLMRMMSPKHNYLIPEAFKKIPHDMLLHCSYKHFISDNAKI